MLRKLFDSPWLYFLLAMALIVAGILSQFRQVAVDAPKGGVADFLHPADRSDLNVVFIVIDTLRADRLSAYGYQRLTSPNIDALAARGIRFAHAESQSSWTKASMASLWTGMYPQRTGVTRFAHALPPEALLPAEVFKQAGYRTAGVWRNGWLANNFGFGQGFDLYYRPSPNRPVARIHRSSRSAHALQGTDRDSTDSASEFIVGVGDDPFFLYVHYMDVHQYLYADTSPEYGSSFSDIYDSAIHWTDQNVGALVDVLRTRGLLDKTLIVIAADHGEAFFEHGGEGHARTLYGEVQEVPLIIVPPVALDPPLVIEEPVANIDIWPTILEMVGLPPLPDAQGRSLIPLIEASAGLGSVPEDLHSRPLFAQIDRSWGRSKRDDDPLVSIVKGPFRMLHQPLRPGHLELYDKSVDPGEQENIADTQPETTAELAKDVDELLEGLVAWGKAPEIELDEMEQAQLRALGYVVEGEGRPRPPNDVEGSAARKKKWGED